MFRHPLCFALASLLSCGCGGDGRVDSSDGGALTWPDRLPAEEGECRVADTYPLPVINGSFQRVFTPPGTRYLNDHTIVRGRDGVYHLYGITHESVGMPHAERSLLHATARSLGGPWRAEDDILTVMAPKVVLWAPFAFEHQPDRWVMYFWGGTPDNLIQRADSIDLSVWTRVATPARGGRDPFVIRLGNRWYLYSVGVSPRFHGQIVLSTSENLIEWSNPQVVIEDPHPSFEWGNLESPTVVQLGRFYYLFLTRTSESPLDYARTMVFASQDPATFVWQPITEILAHAAEVFVDDGHWMITSSGWTSRLGERWRGLSVANLRWMYDCAPSPDR